MDLWMRVADGDLHRVGEFGGDIAEKATEQLADLLIMIAGELRVGVPLSSACRPDPRRLRGDH